jgi:hypothetical protein
MEQVKKVTYLLIALLLWTIMLIVVFRITPWEWGARMRFLVLVVVMWGSLIGVGAERAAWLIAEAVHRDEVALAWEVEEEETVSS